MQGEDRSEKRKENRREKNLHHQWGLELRTVAHAARANRNGGTVGNRSSRGQIISFAVAKQGPPPLAHRLDMLVAARE